ncbi:hypothetical protein ACFZDK_26430 [Streptomyces sp. NPDC007901]|uniref:hypothetical protein n=1 Tax=Streptomyces sp. NPDC007901 TaxID=3364785 RepID=UPI0036E4977F
MSGDTHTRERAVGASTGPGPEEPETLRGACANQPPERWAFARRNIADARSRVAPGRHEVLVGRSSTEFSNHLAVEL